MRASRVPVFSPVVAEDDGEVLMHAAPADGGGMVFGYQEGLSSDVLTLAQWSVFQWLLFGELDQAPPGFRFLRDGETVPEFSKRESAACH